MIELEKTETGFAYMIEAYKTGGPYMHLITLFGVLALIISVWKIVELASGKMATKKYLDLIRMSGSLALAIGFLSQIVGFVQALEAIRAAGDISPSLVYAGVTISFYAPIWGFMVFILAIFSYYVLKEIINSKVKK